MTAYQHRPLSKILAPSAAEQADSKSPKEPEPEAKQQEPDLPEKYRGKTAKEIAEMHINAEKRLGQIQNEVGQLRGLVTELSQLNRTPAPTEKVREKVDVSGNELVSDPVGSIRKVVQHELDDLKEEQKKFAEESKLQREMDSLVKDFGDIPTIVTSDQFQEFANRTASRQADMQTVMHKTGIDQVRAARRLLEDYQDFQNSIKPQAVPEEKRESKPPKRVNEGAGAAGRISSGERIYESDVLELLRTDPAKYRSPSYQKALVEAIREGRYIKN